MQSRCHTPSSGSLKVRQMMRVERLDGRMMHVPTGSSLLTSSVAASAMEMFLNSGWEMGRATKLCVQGAQRSCRAVRGPAARHWACPHRVAPAASAVAGARLPLPAAACRLAARKTWFTAEW